MRIIFSFLLLIVFFGSIACLQNQKLSTTTSQEEDYIRDLKLHDRTFLLDLVLGADRDVKKKFKQPASVAIDSRKNIYVADFGNQRIQVFSNSGEHIDTFGKRGRNKANILFPRALTIDEEDILYVAGNSRSINRVSVLSADGRLLNSFNIPFPPKKITTLGDYLYFYVPTGGPAEFVVCKYSKKGEFLSGFEKRPSTVSEKTIEKFAMNFALDSDGNCYFAYRFLPKVKKISPEGKTLMEFEYQAPIKNKKKPIETITTSRSTGSGSVVYGVDVVEHPLCYDIAINPLGEVHLLVAVDHEKESLCALLRFDEEGSLLDQAPLPVRCERIMIDRFYNIYFYSANYSHLVNRYRFYFPWMPKAYTKLNQDLPGENGV